ncbi:hypothetical protein SESBI_21889 [Sesbania bispinosa]|nr:hypothetical protein SESBI_21889 [Sesbania bispinosa]
MANPTKKSRGRQKIEMKKMSNESNLQVTFSKRRNGLFKKASELCTLCGANVALIVFSPGLKVFSFGHPNVDAVINRYLKRVPPQNSGTMQFIEAHRNANVHEMNAQLAQINNQLENERKHGEELNRMQKAAQAQFLWAYPVEEMNRVHLEQFKFALEELKKHVTHYCDRLLIQGATSVAAATNPTDRHHHIFTIAPPVGSSSNLPLLQTPPPPQVFPPQFLQNPMLQNHLFDHGSLMRHHGFNNLGGYGNPRFF